MSITYSVFQKASSDPEKYARETFSPDAGQRWRAIIPATIRETRSHPSGTASMRDHACVISDLTTGNADVHHLIDSRALLRLALASIALALGLGQAAVVS